MKKFIIIALFAFTPLLVVAAGDPNTYNQDFSINLPDRAEDVRDIGPLSGGSMSSSQIVAGVSQTPSKYAHRTIAFNEVGFMKSSYRPYAYPITREEILKKERLTILAGTTVFFFNTSSHPLQIEGSDGALFEFDMKEPAQSSPEPVYQYLFTTPGTYTLRNALRTYQQVDVIVKDPNESDACVIRETLVKDGVAKEKESRAPWCDVPHDSAAVVMRSDDGNQKQAVVCIQVITSARNRVTGEVRNFSTPCDVPEGWERLPLGYREEKQAKPKKEEKLVKNEQPAPPQKPSKVTKLPKKFSHLRGRILLQTQSRGQAWYVNPKTGARSFLGRPNDAFATMRKQGVGVSNADFARLFGVVPAGNQKLYVKDTALGMRLAGAILLQVERNGEAYYLDPANQTGYYLGRPADAFAIMRGRGLGITDANLSEVPAAE